MIIIQSRCRTSFLFYNCTNNNHYFNMVIGATSQEYLDVLRLNFMVQSANVLWGSQRGNYLDIQII